MTFRRISTSDRSAYSEIIELSNAILDVTLRPLVEAGCDLSGRGFAGGIRMPSRGRRMAWV